MPNSEMNLSNAYQQIQRSMSDSLGIGEIMRLLAKPNPFVVMQEKMLADMTAQTKDAFQTNQLQAVSKRLAAQHDHISAAAKQLASLTSPITQAAQIYSRQISALRSLSEPLLRLSEGSFTVPSRNGAAHLKWQVVIATPEETACSPDLLDCAGNGVTAAARGPGSKQR